MNGELIKNCPKVYLRLFSIPILLLLSVFLFLYFQNSLTHDSYIFLQKGLFLDINKYLSSYSQYMFNLTHLGDGLILLSILTILMFYYPRLWEYLLVSFLVSGIFTIALKAIFSIKRPAGAYFNENFTVLGDRLTGSNSFPSGHSITVFTILSVLLFAFMPRSFRYKSPWVLFVCTVGLLLIVTRIAVGAHYPLDVFTGAVLGYLCALIGIILNQRLKLWNWLPKKLYKPISIVALLVCLTIVFFKILDSNLLIYYFAEIILLLTISLTTYNYVKK